MSNSIPHRSFAAALLVLGMLSAAPRAQQPDAAASSLTIDDLIREMNRSEAALTARVRGFHPLVEVYIQNLGLDERLGSVPIKDEYFLGRFDWTDGPHLLPLSQERGALRHGNML